jgi:hypothetical protein
LTYEEAAIVLVVSMDLTDVDVGVDGGGSKVLGAVEQIQLCALGPRQDLTALA